MHYARQRDIDLHVTIYEPKQFSLGGPRACNRSAGILSTSFLAGLRDLPLELPEKVVQTYLTGYQLHSPFGTVPLANPEPWVEPVVVFRGGGPLHGHDQRVESFDGYLLEQAEREGVEVVHRRVDEVRVHPRPAVVSGSMVEEHELVVLACGINSASPEVASASYQAPPACLMAQDELYAGADMVASRLGGTVHIFFIPGSQFVFGSLVPKGAFVNVSLLAKGCEPPSVEEFLAQEMVKKVLDFPYERSCGCRGKAATGPAFGPYDDGFVAIGDACVSRLYKDGIGSALQTARQAARTAVLVGIEAGHFRHGYMPLVRAIERDNNYGEFLFWLHQRAKDSAAFLRAQSRLVSREQQSSRLFKPFSRVIWGMFTGSYPYREILRIVLGPGSLARLATTFLAESFAGARP
jgi:flavin-dependent dehydrogenase